jgi:hypothetical protein
LVFVESACISAKRILVQELASTFDGLENFAGFTLCCHPEQQFLQSTNTRQAFFECDFIIISDLPDFLKCHAGCVEIFALCVLLYEKNWSLAVVDEFADFSFDFRPFLFSFALWRKRHLVRFVGCKLSFIREATWKQARIDALESKEKLFEEVMKD